jgi:hypothetical protein
MLLQRSRRWAICLIALRKSVVTYQVIGRSFPESTTKRPRSLFVNALDQICQTSLCETILYQKKRREPSGGPAR